MSKNTSDDLSTAAKALSLNPALSSFDFSQPFTLVSADGYSFSVDPLKLAGTSNVFADVLGSGTGKRKVVLVENKQEIELYLACVKDGLAPSDEGA
ncbi:hypothetical protein JCM8547_003076 [Rhodosporidiobolus lusitaniae]